MPHRTYTEAEARELLGQAARLHAASHEHGEVLTLDELKRAAEAAGIDPVFVEQAAHAPPTDGVPFEPFFGVPTGVRRSRLVPGPITDEAWGQMVAELRRSLGGTGTVETIGQMRSWTRAPLQLIAEPEGEQVRITATGRWGANSRSSALGTGFLGLFTVLMIAAALVKGEAEVFILAGFFMVMTAAFAAMTWPAYRKKEVRVGKKFDAALDRLAQIARHDVAAQAATVEQEGTTEHVSPLLDVREEEASSSTAAPTSAQRVRS